MTRPKYNYKRPLHRDLEITERIQTSSDTAIFGIRVAVDYGSTYLDVYAHSPREAREQAQRMVGMDFEEGEIL